MKATKLLLSSTCLALAACIPVTQAQWTNLVYQENFNLPTPASQSVTSVGWINDVGGGYGSARIFSNFHGVAYPNCAVNSYTIFSNNEAFYFTDITANGGPYNNGTVTNKMAFPGINLANEQNVTFSVDFNYGTGDTLPYFCVQMNNGSWYVSTNQLAVPGNITFVTDTMNFSPTAGAWKQLTVSGTGSFLDNQTNVIIGGPATADLSGYITGAGLVIQHVVGSSSVNFDNFTISATSSCLPALSVEPTTTTNYPGTTATFIAEFLVSRPIPTSLQWMGGAIGSGVYTNLSDGGQISGSTSSVLQISNVMSANQLDYVLVGSNECGSVTSSPPATLWVVALPPTPLSDTIIYPDDAPNLADTSVTLHAGNHNVMNFTALFIGSQPISFQWQFSPTNDSTGVGSIPGATNSSLTLSDPPTSASGYYRLGATNSLGGPAYSDWVDLTVLPAATAHIQWSAKVPFNGLTAAQILNGAPGAFFEAESFNNYGAGLSVTNGTTVFVFDTTGVSARLVGGLMVWSSGQFLGDSSDANLNAIFGADTECTGGATITLNNLTAGRSYSAQLFAFNNVLATAREANFSDAIDGADVSQSFAMGDNVYVVGTFTATNTTQTISLNGNVGSYLCCLIVRASAAMPVIQWSGSNLRVTWGYGTLLQATNITGPWTTNTTASPYVFSPAAPALFFRTQLP